MFRKPLFHPLRLVTLLIVVGSSLSAADEAARKFHVPSLYHVGFWIRDLPKTRAFYKDFLGYEEPYSLNRPDGSLQMVVMKVNERQVIYLFPDASKIRPNGDNLDHLGLETDNIEAAREHLLAHGVKVGSVNRGRIGDFLLGVKDPDGHAFEITQFAPEGQLLKHQDQGLAPDRVSDHLRSATISVTDLTASLHFYQDILGFKRISADHQSGQGSHPQAVRLQVPDGTDYLDLVQVGANADSTQTRAVPEYCLDVKDAAKTMEKLATRAKAMGLPAPEPVSVAVDGQRQTSCIDPDGTRVILKETP